MNIVSDLDKKSDETIVSASEIECENEYDVTNVIDPATRRQTNAFTADRIVVSSKTRFVLLRCRWRCSAGVAPSWYGTARADSSDDEEDEDDDGDEEDDESWFGID